MANPFMDVDVSVISGLMAEHSLHFLSLVEPDSYDNLHQASLKMSALSGSTYIVGLF